MARKITDNFSDVEVLPKEYHGRKWEIFIDKRIVEIAQELRNVFGAITINDKSIGGNYNLSGWRPFDCKTGAKHSSHKFGRGLDLKFNTKGVDPILVQNYILKNQERFMKLGLTRLENAEITKTWLHIDCSATGLDEIYVFNP